MALNLNWENVQNERVKKYPFEAGCVLMAIGIREVTEKNLGDAAYRIGLYQKLHHELGFTAEELIGLASNVGNETTAKFTKRTLESFRDDHDWNRRKSK